jgi:hypothetical protein
MIELEISGLHPKYDSAFDGMTLDECYRYNAVNDMSHASYMTGVMC